MHTLIKTLFGGIGGGLSRHSCKVVVIVVMMMVGTALSQSDNDVRNSGEVGSEGLAGNQGELQLRGTAKPIQQSLLNAPMDGIIEKIMVEEGDKVRAGVILVQMDDAVQQMVVEAAKVQAENEAEVRNAKMNLAEMEVLLKGWEKAFENGSANEWEVRRARLRRNQTQAAYDVAMKNHELAAIAFGREQEMLRRYTIRAPFDGIVVRVFAEETASVIRDNQLLYVVKMDTLEVTMFLPVELYGQLEIGKMYKMRAEDSQWAERVIVGRLKYCEPLIEARMFRCVFDVDNMELGMPGGVMLRLWWPQ